MASLDSLPADQRAVLQLVLQRGRSYDQIATLLSIDRTAVRERALGAFEALGPETGVPAARRGAIADYLLGQLEPGAAEQTRDRIAQSPSERAWARVVAAELASLSGQPLPEIPASPAPAQARETPAARDEPPVPVPPARLAPGNADAESGSRRGRRRGSREPKEPKPAEPLVPAADEGRRSSRLGGTILIALTVVIVAAVVIILLSSGGSKAPAPAASASSSSTPAPAPAPAAGSGTTSASGSGTTRAKVVAQINLNPTAAGGKARGIAEILKQGTTDGIAIVAQNVTPNTAKPPNAYAVWLYNSPSDSRLLGFVNPGVGANGRLSTAGGLPANASHFKQLIVTFETKASPKTPGKIILQGALTGL